jgi:virginiamycin B lyase
VWFAENGKDKIGKITTAGKIFEYPIRVGSAPWGVWAGPDGNVWFAEEFGNKIGVMNTPRTSAASSLPSTLLALAENAAKC